MRNRVGVILFLALASGLLAAFLAFRFLRQPTVTEATAAETPTVSVMVAARDLPAGHLLQPQDVRPIEWPAGATPQGFTLDPAEVVGRGLIEPVRANEALLASKIASPEAGSGLGIAVPSGFRAVAVRVTEVVGVAGWIHAGQRVDVTVTLDQAVQLEEPVTQIVLQDVTVLRIGHHTETNDRNEAVNVTVVTLAVTPEEVEILTLSDTKGEIRLALRNPLDRDTISTPGVRARELVFGRRPVSTPGPTRLAPRRPSSVSVEIISGTEKRTESAESGGGR